MVADADDVVGSDDRAGDPVAVDVGSVGAAVVDEFPLVAGAPQHGMVAGDQQVVEHDVVIGARPIADD